MRFSQVARGASHRWFPLRPVDQRGHGTVRLPFGTVHTVRMASAPNRESTVPSANRRLNRSNPMFSYVLIVLPTIHE
jgi:hypothetical protein